MQQSGTLPVNWSAADCKATPESPSRIYVGSDGVMVPLVTDAEKATRRQKIKGTSAALRQGATATAEQARRGSAIQGVQDRRFLR